MFDKKQSKEIKELTKLTNKMSQDSVLDAQDVELLRKKANEVIKDIVPTKKFFKRLS